MLAALAVVIPLGLAGAVSPVMLTEQTVLLAGPGGGRAGVRYAAGVILTAFVFVLAFVLFGRALSLPTEPHLDAQLDIVLGLILVGLAVLVFVSGRRRSGVASGGGDDGGASGSHHARAAFPFGAFSMATNFKTLALIAAAAKEISKADEVVSEAVLILVLVVLVSMAAWVPVALTKVAPGPTERGLAAVRDQIARRGRGFTVGVLSAAGLFFLGRGLIRLIG